MGLDFYHYYMNGPIVLTELSLVQTLDPSGMALEIPGLFSSTFEY